MKAVVGEKKLPGNLDKIQKKYISFFRTFSVYFIKKKKMLLFEENSFGFFLRHPPVRHAHPKGLSRRTWPERG